MRIGINGCGRVGRLVLRSTLARGVNLDVVAINDRGDAAINAYLFQFDSTYGPFRGRVEADGDRIIIDDLLGAISDLGMVQMNLTVPTQQNDPVLSS